MAAPGGESGWRSTDGDVVTGERAHLRLNSSATDYFVRIVRAVATG